MPDLTEMRATAKMEIDDEFGNVEAGMLLNSAADEIARLRAALVKTAIVSRHRMAEGGGTVFIGHFCEICEAECEAGKSLIHVGDCPLTVLNQS